MSPSVRFLQLIFPVMWTSAITQTPYPSQSDQNEMLLVYELCYSEGEG